MEEAYDEFDGVISSISGYLVENLKIQNTKMLFTDTGHVEAVETIYDPNKITYERLLDIFWLNIDPFDAEGQFCDKGKSYRSVIFYENEEQKKMIEKSFKDLEKKFNKKIVTLVWKFDAFYVAENYHQDYYEKNFIRYLMYKKSCAREETLRKIWN